LVTLWNDEQCLGRGKAEIEELEKKKKKRKCRGDDRTLNCGMQE